MLTGRNTTPIHSYGREFAFSGLMKCADCGGAVVAEIKKGKYIYYHCTGHAEHSYMDDGIRLLELARNARELFAKQEAHEKKRVLNLVLSNSIWRQGEVEADFQQPFDLLIKITQRSRRKATPA